MYVLCVPYLINDGIYSFSFTKMEPKPLRMESLSSNHDVIIKGYYD